MKKITLLLTAALASVVASSAFASTVLPVAATTHKVVAPAPVEIVHPTNLPQRYNNQTVNLRMTIDEKGRPYNVRLLDYDDELAARLLPAVSQWKFTPGTVDGHPVKRVVILPLQLEER